MTEEISIKVNIADAVFPLKISLKDEERVRKAAKMINDKIRAYREDFPTQDKVNLLSMVALQFATELLQYREKNFIEDDGITGLIEEIASLLEKAEDKPEH